MQNLLKGNSTHDWQGNYHHLLNSINQILWVRKEGMGIGQELAISARGKVMISPDSKAGGSLSCA